MIVIIKNYKIKDYLQSNNLYPDGERYYFDEPTMVYILKNFKEMEHYKLDYFNKLKIKREHDSECIIVYEFKDCPYIYGLLKNYRLYNIYNYSICNDINKIKKPKLLFSKYNNKYDINEYLLNNGEKNIHYIDEESYYLNDIMGHDLINCNISIQNIDNNKIYYVIKIHTNCFHNKYENGNYKINRNNGYKSL